MGNITLYPEEDDSPLKTISKGALVGGSALAAIYGANELKDFIKETLEDKPRTLPKVIYFRDPRAKKIKLAMYKAGSSSPMAGIARKFLYGMSIPLGTLGAYHILDYLNAKTEEGVLRNKLTELDLALRGMHPAEVEKSKLKKAGSIKEKELIKMACDPEINKYLDESIEKRATPFDWISLIDAVPTYLPYILGVGAGLSGIAGYYGTKNYLDQSITYPKDVLREPELAFGIKKSRYNPPTLGYMIKSSGRKWDQFLHILNPFKLESPITTSKNMGNLAGELYSDVSNWVFPVAKSQSPIGRLKSWVKEKEQNLGGNMAEGAKKKIFNKKTLGNLLLGGSAIAIPSLLSGFLTMNPGTKAQRPAPAPAPAPAPQKMSDSYKGFSNSSANLRSSFKQ